MSLTKYIAMVTLMLNIIHIHTQNMIAMGTGLSAK